MQSAPCSFAVNGSSGLISSSSSEKYFNCTWIITVPSNHTVKLNFTIFQLSAEWSKAEIKVFDGRSTSDTLLGIFTGAKRPFIVQSSDRFMLIKLEKSSAISLSYFKSAFFSSSTKGESLSVYQYCSLNYIEYRTLHILNECLKE